MDEHPRVISNDSRRRFTIRCECGVSSESYTEEPHLPETCVGAGHTIFFSYLGRLAEVNRKLIGCGVTETIICTTVTDWSNPRG